MNVLAVLLLGLGIALSWLGTVVGTCTQASADEMWAGIVYALPFYLGGLLVLLRSRPTPSARFLSLPLLAILPPKLLTSLSLFWNTNLKGLAACAWKTGHGFGPAQPGDFWLAPSYLLADLLLIACAVLVFRRAPRPTRTPETGPDVRFERQPQ